MRAIRHYWQVYKHFFSTSYSVSTSFRTSFILIVLMDIFFYISTLGMVDMIYQYVSEIGAWNRAQFLFFISFMLVLDQLHMVFLSQNFWELSEKIRTGQMDYILLKPLHSLFNCFFRHVRVSSMINGPLVWGVLIHFGIEAGLTTLAWCMLPLLMLCSFIILALVEFILSTSMFWTVGGVGINFLRMQMQSVARWPDYVYAPWPRRILTVLIPALLIANPSVKFLFNPQDWIQLVIIVASIAILSFILLLFWKVAVARYESASS